MNPISLFILSTAISVSTPRLPSSDTNNAINAITKASFLQAGLDVRLKQYEEEYINETVRKYTGWAMITIKMANEKKISYEWTF